MIIQAIGPLGKAVFVDVITMKVIQGSNLTAYTRTTEERLALARHKLLAVSSGKLFIHVIPTWQCNLRCTHCFVSQNLVDKDECTIDMVSFANFVTTHHRRYSTGSLHLNFIGGESMLTAKASIEILKCARRICDEAGMRCDCRMTTNLAMDLGTSEIEFINLLDGVMVSLDGPPRVHNAQRKSDKIPNPWLVTYKNIASLSAIPGVRPKIKVQAALSHADMSPQVVADFKYLLRSVGLADNQMLYGFQSPSLINKDKERKATESLMKAAGIGASPCCSFRYMSNFNLLPDGSLSTDYHHINEGIIGTINTSFESLESAYGRYILEHMDALHDEACTSCPALGSCWGRCTGYRYITDGRPSTLCDRDGNIEAIKRKAADGSLVRLIEHTREAVG